MTSSFGVVKLRNMETIKRNAHTSSCFKKYDENKVRNLVYFSNNLSRV